VLVSVSKSLVCSRQVKRVELEMVVAVDVMLTIRVEFVGVGTVDLTPLYGSLVTVLFFPNVINSGDSACMNAVQFPCRQTEWPAVTIRTVKKKLGGICGGNGPVHEPTAAETNR
jgi:hypothetical protein